MSLEFTAVADTKSQIDTSNNSGAEANEEYWDDSELTSLVIENEHTMVECPWEPGIEKTLSAVTIEWPVPIRAYNVDSVIAVLRQLLENAEVKKLVEEEATEDEKEVQEDVTSEIENDKETDVKNSTEINDKQPSESEAKQRKIVNAIVAMPTAPTPTANGQSNTVQFESADVTRSSNNGEATLREPISAKTTAPKTPNTTRTNYTPAESSLNTIVAPTLPPKIEQTNIATGITTQTKPETQTSEPSQVDIYPEIIIADETEQTLTTLPEVMDQEVENLITPDDLDDQLESDEAPTEMPEAELAIEISDDQQANDITFGSMDKRETDKVIITQTEDAIIEISEQLENATAETTQMIHEILDEIIELPTKIKSEARADTISESEAQEQLIELFTELFDELQIDYTPELLDSLATITIHGHFTIEAEDLNDQEEVQNSATHTVVKQLYTALTNLKAEANQVCVIGKSALLHYGLSIAA